MDTELDGNGGRTMKKGEAVCLRPTDWKNRGRYRNEKR